jgi:hypothetical protein
MPSPPLPAPGRQVGDDCYQWIVDLGAFDPASPLAAVRPHAPSRTALAVAAALGAPRTGARVGSTAGGGVAAALRGPRPL